MLKRTLAMAIAMIMTLALISLPAFASISYTKEINFNTGDEYASEYYLPFSEYTTNADFAASPGKFNYDEMGNFITSSGRIMHYAANVFGRDAGDRSEALRVYSEGPVTFTNTSAPGHIYYQVFDVGSSNTLHDGRFYEFSVVKSGDVSVKIQPTGGVGSAEQTLALPDNEWVRVSIWFQKPKINGSTTVYPWSIYINGVRTYYKENTTGGMYRSRIRLSVPTDKSSLSGYAAIDDFRYITGANGLDEYTPEPLPDVSIAAEQSYFDRTNNVLYIPSNLDMSVTELESALTKGSNATMKVYSPDFVPNAKGPDVVYSAEAEKINSDIIAIDDKIVITDKTDGFNNMRYITIKDRSDLDIDIDFDDNDADMAVYTGGVAPTRAIEKVSGLYTKDAGNTSYLLTATRTEANPSTAQAARIDIDKTSEETKAILGKTKSTVEFSMAIDGIYNLAEFHIGYNYGSSKIATLFRVNPNGIVQNPSAIRNYKIGSKKWVRIAATTDPETSAYTTYINGVKIEEAILASGLEPDPGFSFTRMAVNIQVGGEVGSTASVALDDIKIYPGEYKSESSIGEIENASDRNSALYTTETDYTALMDGITVAAGETKQLYNLTGGHYTVKNDSVAAGDVLVIGTADGLIKKYYTISNADAFEVGNIILTKGENEISASVNAKYFDADKISPNSAPAVLILATYKDGCLEKVILSEAKAFTTATTPFSASYTGNTENISAKAFFLDSLNSMIPYVEAAIFPLS